MITNGDFSIPVLGPSKFDSPFLPFLPEDFSEEKIFAFESAGPQKSIFFNPFHTTAAIVTCGGICPGLNDVIRSLVMNLWHGYSVRRIFGIRNGYQGFIARYNHEPIILNPEIVSEIHKKGGTILGTSRGQQDIDEIVDFLERKKINVLFIIGGDGTQRGAFEIACRIKARDLTIAVIGIPKTVDNDILYLDRSFGFATAVSVACKVIETARNEAISQPNGVGLVKVMGRASGFIACLAALAGQDADFVLIPEVPFGLEGGHGFLAHLKERISQRGHAVVLVAEGAGQDLFPIGEGKCDASGNVRFRDIGLFLKERIENYFKEEKNGISLKYIDPSYIIRAVPAVPADSVYCNLLGAHAVHAAMSGKTQIVLGLVNNRYVHIPMTLIIQGRKRVDPKGLLWLSVLGTTGQPAEMAEEKFSRNKL